MMQGSEPWYPVDSTNDFSGTGEFNDSLVVPVTTLEYAGPHSAFSSGPAAIPCFGTMSGCTPYSKLPGGAPPSVCVTSAQAPYAGDAGHSKH